jgi:hypothetical protein
LKEISAKMSEFNTAEAVRIKSSWENILEKVRNGIRKAGREKKTENEKSLSLLPSLFRSNTDDENSKDKEKEEEKKKAKENEEKEGNGELERETGRDRGRGSAEIGMDDQTLNIDRRHWESFRTTNDDTSVSKEADKTTDTARDALLRTYGVVLSDACFGQTLFSPEALSSKS